MGSGAWVEGFRHTKKSKKPTSLPDKLVGQAHDKLNGFLTDFSGFWRFLMDLIVIIWILTDF